MQITFFESINKINWLLVNITFVKSFDIWSKKKVTENSKIIKEKEIKRKMKKEKDVENIEREIIKITKRESTNKGLKMNEIHNQSKTRPVLDRFQDCCKNWFWNWGFASLVVKKDVCV